ncbi:MAG: hypothetical protein JJU31_05285 [Wenzhouxiangella sp.]|nr:hypothetical protein [Wenzhouxiangella sp.]MCH8479128.1 hypothetical protein [Wenzhouxiangella sp.]
MVRQTVVKLFWGMVLLALVAPATADILLIEKVRERMLRDLPGNGLSMSEVEARYGAPLERHAAVGQPPITRWIYADYSVYFEYQLVIESVLHHEAVVREVQRRNN